MKIHWLSVAALVALSACSSVPLEEPAPGDGAGAPLSLEQPLSVPPLSALPETPVRPLHGRYTAVSWGSVPGWADDDLGHVWKALLNDCRGLMRPVSGSLALPARAAPRAWQPVCRAAVQSGLGPQAGGLAVRQFLQEQLRPWRLDDASGQAAAGTVTGYYEPLIRASRVRQGAYQWPLYATPDDLLTIDLGAVYPELAGKRVRGKLEGRRVVPYDTRAQIAADPDRQPAVIVWADDPVEAFFLQIQGSGRAILPDGGVLRLAYADHNGRPYASIGQWLARQGEMPLARTSMQNIKAWARAHPDRVTELLNVNPAMVFFREEPIVDPELGPRGAYGVPLMPQRSIAVDPAYVPLGTPVFLDVGPQGGAAPLRRLVFAQDTGAAIKGAARADFYWGTGEAAGARAGRMKQSGRMWLLWPARAGAPSAR
ncbi:MAG: murein transglycosylase A [Castellaniella sp.]|uniref:murein transglycosylase A n=1 Tax=Castellaniella sp. TaxID=1955812 RepID=UPI002A36BBAF|nr:murein transglycosylase A [Castellaniella sp.]MDY0308485.1 murein transglycosylase A [Castellaniella sp.]